MTFEAPIPMVQLVRTLERSMHLSPEDRAAILALPHRLRNLDARQDIAGPGERSKECCLVLSGWTYRYSILRGGSRQILSFAVTGDIPDLQHLHLPVMDHTLASLTRCALAFIPHPAMHALVDRHPAVRAALWRNALVDASRYRERIVNLGRRRAANRLAHLFCEMYLRLERVGLARDHCFDLPTTQADLADTLGLTSVHINRSLRELRAQDLIAFERGHLAIVDWAGLARLSDFDPTYLHFGNPDA